MRSRALQYYSAYAATTQPLLFSTSATEGRILPPCFSHHASAPYAVTTLYSDPSRQRALVCPLGRSLAHFTNADRLFITAEASDEARECGWRQCLWPALLERDEHLRLLLPFYSRVLFLELSSVLPFRQFAPQLLLAPPVLPAYTPQHGENKNSLWYADHNIIVLAVNAADEKNKEKEEGAASAATYYFLFLPDLSTSCWRFAEHGDICLLLSWIGSSQ
jgi:hypothetical protein